MKSYKLYKIYPEYKDKLMSLIEEHFKPEDIIFLNKDILAVYYPESDDDVKKLYDKMTEFPVKQKMYTDNVFVNILKIVSERRQLLDISFFEDIPEPSLTIIKGYIERIQTETIEPLRLNDTQQLLSELSYLATEKHISIEKIKMNINNNIFYLYSYGVIQLSIESFEPTLISILEWE